MQPSTNDANGKDDAVLMSHDKGTRAQLPQSCVFESILKTISAGVFWRDRDGRIGGCNDVFCEFVGMESVEKVIGQKMGDLLPCLNEITNPQSCFGDCPGFPVEPISLEERVADCQGRVRTVLSKTSTIHDPSGEAIGTLGIFQDITASKSAETSATAFAKVIRESPNELYIFDAETLEIVEANHGFSENLGVPYDQLIGMSPLDFLKDITEAELLEQLTDARSDEKCESGFNSVHVNDALEPGEFQMFEASRLGFNSVHTRSDQTTYPVHVDISESIFEDRPVFVAFCSDLTDRQAMEHQLFQAQKLESVGQLAAGVAHEINTPMQCVSGNVEFLTKGNQGLLEVADGLIELIDAPEMSMEARQENRKKLMKRLRYDVLRRQTRGAIDESAQAVKRVIEIVRAMKVMAHPGKRERADVDLKLLLEQAAVITRNRWKLVAELQLDLLEEVPCVQGYSAELSQVFVNLIVNAADAILERKEAEPGIDGEIGISTKVLGECLEIRISDNGTGIPEADSGQVFNQFFTTKDVGKGTGMGLSISYDIIVTKHQGKIELISEVGRGTEFVVSLPLGESVESASPSQESSCPNAGTLPLAPTFSASCAVT